VCVEPARIVQDPPAGRGPIRLLRALRGSRTFEGHTESRDTQHGAYPKGIVTLPFLELFEQVGGAGSQFRGTQLVRASRRTGHEVRDSESELG